MSSIAKICTSPGSFVKRTPPVPGAVFDTYWHFAAKRQSIFHRRVQGLPRPWTQDEVLHEFKFTNPYRAADRVSQYLIRNVIYQDRFSLRDTVLRTLLFKLFNKIETWELLENVLGPIDERRFDAGRFASILSKAMAGGASIYSGAYIMPSGPASIRRERKHEMHLALLSELMRNGLPEELVECRTMGEAYALLLAVPSIGPFLAYQFTTDLNYSAFLNFSEMEFVVPGPGARDGLRKCFASLGDYSEADAIRWVTERQQEEFRRRNLRFEPLWGRPLQLIDCQNLFCEVDKYSRVVHPDIAGRTGRTRIKQTYKAVQAQQLPQPWFPPKWGLNARIAESLSPRPAPHGCMLVTESLHLA
jgi:hypothetical protein